MASTSWLRVAATASGLLGVPVMASRLAGLVAPGFDRLVHPILLAGSYGQDWMSLAGRDDDGQPGQPASSLAPICVSSNAEVGTS
jgi:hypothetical protein